MAIYKAYWKIESPKLNVYNIWTLKRVMQPFVANEIQNEVISGAIRVFSL